VQRRVRLAVDALDDQRDRSLRRDTYPRDRYDYDREEVLRDALQAWRVNPLARRIVELTSQYVVGGGIGIESKHAATNKFLKKWWEHRLNQMAIRAFEWCDELTRSGELYFVVSTDAAGMSYVRAMPAMDILDIETALNDVDQELVIWEKPRGDGLDGIGPGGVLSGHKWQVYNSETDSRNEDGSFSPVMLHYAVNKPVGAKFGESDLAPLLRWLARYAAWLEDRARLNRYRNSFVFTVKARFASAAEKEARQAELNANPPPPGSILVMDETETWEVLAPQLSSFEANEDGLALKKMVAAGSGNPLHFLAEPEGATRTTAESAGGPTFRHYEQRQLYFLWLLEDLTKVVLRRAALVDSKIDPKAEISIKGTDISARDNAALATAASTITAAMGVLRDRGMIDDSEYLRMVYRFAGEVSDVEDLLEKGKKAPPPMWYGQPAQPADRNNPNNPEGPTQKGGPGSKPGGSGGNGKIDVPGVKVKPVKVNPITGEPSGGS
jgi:hypothetical protein